VIGHEAHVRTTTQQNFHQHKAIETAMGMIGNEQTAPGSRHMREIILFDDRNDPKL